MVPVWWIHYHRYQINWISLSFLACPFLLCLWKVSKKSYKISSTKIDSKLWKRVCFFLNTRYLLANQNRPFRQVNFPFSVIFKFSRFFYLRMIFRAEAKSINKLSPPVKYQRISTQCWRYLFLLLDSFFECSKLMSPPDSKWKDKSYNKVAKSGNLEEVWTIFYN